MYEGRIDISPPWNEDSQHDLARSEARAPFSYGVYGICLRSEFALSLPAPPVSPLLEVELTAGSQAIFSHAIRDVKLQDRPDWYQYAHIEDGSSYVRWSGVGEFLVSSDGRRIVCGRESQATAESFQVYLLGQALSFALVKSGFEPLHATVLAVDEGAIAFLGESGAGKSSLAACFLAAGGSMLTDDLLVLEQRVDGLLAYPGPPRIKLLPDIAEYFLGGTTVGVPMNPETSKLVLPLAPNLFCSSPRPLRAIYQLAPPHENQRENIRTELLSRREAFLTLVRNTFNYLVVDADRLQRLLAEITRVAMAVRVKRLYYPRRLDYFPYLREAIHSDLKHSSPGDGQDGIP